MATVIDGVKRGKKGLPEKGQMVIDNGTIEWRGEKDGTKTLGNVKNVSVGLAQPGAVLVTYGEPQQQELFLDFRQGSMKVQGQAKVLEQDIRNALGLAPAAASAPLDPAVASNFQRTAAQSQKSSGAKSMIGGAIALAIGVTITVVTYSNASNSSSGGRYFVLWGPMLFGFIYFVQGLYNFVKGNAALRDAGPAPAVSASPPSAAPPSPAPPPATAPTASYPPPSPPGPIADAPSAMPPSTPAAPPPAAPPPPPGPAPTPPPSPG